MREEPTPLPTPLNQLSDAQLHTLADAVEAQNPWSGFAYHAICTTRRFMVTIWALVIFPYVSPNLWIAAIFCGMALVFDLLVSSKSPDMTITPRDVVFHFAKHWDDEILKFQWTYYRNWLWVIPIAVLGTVHLVISYGCGFHYISPLTSHWMYIFITMAVVGWMSRYFLEKLVNMQETFQAVHNLNLYHQRLFRFKLIHIITIIPVVMLSIPVYILCFFRIPYTKIFKSILFWSVIVITVSVIIIFLELGPVFILLTFESMCKEEQFLQSFDHELIISGGSAFCFVFLHVIWLRTQRLKYHFVANAILKHYGVHFSQTTKTIN